MEITKDILEKLPLSEYPDDYDEVDKITEDTLNEFNVEADNIERRYDNKSIIPTKIVAEGKDKR